jgi:hemoglobin
MVGDKPMDRINSLQRFDMSYDDLNNLVTSFYALVRKHPILGPVFNNAVGTSVDDWRAHEEKIAGFWSNAILMDRRYQGNPMRVHMMTPEVLPEHFPVWLDLFEETARHVLSKSKADNITALARRIGAGLSYGLEHYRSDQTQPPFLG